MRTKVKAEEAISLSRLGADRVPEKLKVGYYFDFSSRPFEHQALFGAGHSVTAALDQIGPYARKWLASFAAQREGRLKPSTPAVPSTGRYQVLAEEGAVFLPNFVEGTSTEPPGTIYPARGAKVLGGIVDVSKGDVSVGEQTELRGAAIQGPTILGSKNEVRPGAYFRGDVVVGNGCTLRGELKNVVIMDKGNFPHPSYLGDSLCGHATHFGNQATSANLGIYALVTGKENIKIKADGKTYDLGRAKIGIVMGDFSQVGCNAVSDPGTFLAPYTIVYALARLNKGFYGPRQVLKNKPMEKGIIEIAPLEK